MKAPYDDSVHTPQADREARTLMKGPSQTIQSNKQVGSVRRVLIKVAPYSPLRSIHTTGPH
jgi:hypothetical protein